MEHVQSGELGIEPEEGLHDTGTRRRGRKPGHGRAKGVKLEPHGVRMTGRVARMFYGQSYGFIRTADRRDVFFHRKDVRGQLFNALAVNDRVVFELIEDRLAGPRGVRVTRAS